MEAKEQLYKQIRIEYTDKGKGKALVFLHGFLENKSMWDFFVTHFSNTNRVIAIDLLGHGQTENLGYIHTMEEQATMVHSVLQAININEAVFIGHSMGGYVALTFAKKFPNFVKGMLLQNSTAAADSDEKKINRDRAIKVLKQNPTNFVSMAISNLFSEENQTLLKSTIEKVKNEALKTSVQGIIAALEGMKIRESSIEILKKDAFPIILVLGKKDAVLNFDETKKQITETNVKLVAFNDGHMSHIENQNELLALMDVFFTEMQ